MILNAITNKLKGVNVNITINGIPVLKGGKGSGNFDHKGRPGEVGGSGEGISSGNLDFNAANNFSIPMKQAIKSGYDKMAEVFPLGIDGIKHIKDYQIPGTFAMKSQNTLFYDGNIINNNKLLQENLENWKGLSVSADNANTPEEYISNITVHELGHVMAFRLLNEHEDVYRNELEPLLVDTGKKGEIPSVYGQESSAEFEAEAIADFVLSKKPLPISIKIVSIFQRYYGKKSLSKGGKGSGHFGHKGGEGGPGNPGGSSGGGGEGEEVKEKNPQPKGGDRTKTKAFRRWFGKSKIVDDKGNPLVLYHGTTRTFSEFDRKFANPESDLGAGFYFTNNPEDLGSNYAGFGPDVTGKIESRAEQIQQELSDERGKEVEMDEARKLARREFADNEGASIPVYLKMDNPLYIGGKKESYLDYEMDEDGNEKGKLVDFIVSLRDISNRYGDFSGGKVDDVVTKILEEEDGISASKLVDIISKDEEFNYYTDDNGKLVSKEIMRAAFEAAGYDGIIDSTVDIKFGSQRRIGQKMRGMNPGTIHFIAFEPTQIKSAIGNETFDPNNPSLIKRIINLLKLG